VHAAEAYRTPTGQPCPRSVQLDGTVCGSGDCHGCGYCLLLEAAAWCGRIRAR